MIKEISKSSTILDFGKIRLKRNEIKNSYALQSKTSNDEKVKTSLLIKGIKRTILSLKG